jgi:ectoine hydroxylase-related dioxygenase (phytanoyl-CoA dioxygenase family)
MMTSIANEQTDRVLTEGFTVVRRAVDRDVATELRSALARLVAQQRACADDRAAADDYIVHNPMVLDRRFLDLLENPTIIDSLDTFLGPTSILYAYRSSSMHAGGSNDSRRVHVDSPRVIPEYMTNLGVIVALDDFTDDNGATFFLPRSFERTDQPCDEEFFAGAQRVHPKRGDLVVFNARTFHSGGVNVTDQDRHAVGMNWCRSFMRQRFDYPRLIGDELGDSLSPTLRRVLGFDVRVPTSLDEYYLPADQRLYKANQG